MSDLDNMDDQKSAEARRAQKESEKGKQKEAMVKVRERYVRMNLNQKSLLVPVEQNDWWTAQSNITLSKYCIWMIDQGDKYDDLVNEMANMRVRRLPKLGYAKYIQKSAPEDLQKLAADYMSAVRDQITHREYGEGALATRDYDTAQRSFAMDYALSMRGKGLHMLYEYYLNGGSTPEVYYHV